MNRTENDGLLLAPAELQDRIQEAHDRLDELDKNDVTYESKRMVGESRLANLQKALEDPVSWDCNHREREENLRMAQEMNQFLPVAESPQRPQSSHETMRPLTGFAPYAGSSINSFGGHFASDGVMAGQGRPAHAAIWNVGSQNTEGPGTPTFLNDRDRPSSASASSVDSAVLPRKRQRTDPGISRETSARVSKAHRHTPSPSMSGPDTPSSYESFGPAEGISEDLYGLFGGDPNEAAREFETSRQEQEEHMRVMEARRQQEREDEEFAKTLQEELNGQGSPATAHNAGPSISNSNQTYLDSNGQVHRPVPMSSSPIPIFDDPFASTSNLSKPQAIISQPSSLHKVRQDNPYPNLSGNAPVKREPSYQPNLRGAPSNNFDGFINLDSDDDEGVNSPPILPAAHPSSDIVEIGSQSWLDSNNRIVPGAFSQGPHTVPGSFGTHHGNINWGSVTDTAHGYANNFYDAVGLSMSRLGASTGLGGTSVYGGSYHDPNSGIPIVDLDREPYAPQSFYQRSMARAGLDPTNMGLVDIYRQRYDYIAHDPTRTAREMKELLENIRPDEDLPPENREGTPAAMVYPLMEHQKLGVAWMRRMEEGSNRGGILADDMGLGKTIQALALMVSRRSTTPARKTTLIVAPVALLKQWEREINKKLKPGQQHSLSSFIYHGPKKAPWEKLRTFDVVLTTFGVVATELKRKEAIDVAKRDNPNWRPRSSKDILSLLGEECRWYRVIIDEAQCIKNKNTRAAVGCCMLQAETRFCMTGTPMMNNVGELFSLIHFLRIRPYCDKNKFRHDIEGPLKGQSDSLKKKAMRQLQALLKSLLLRRTKKSQIDGKPILDLPPRTTTMQHSVFSEDEQAFYKALETMSRLQFNKYLKAGTVGRNYSNILVLLLRLRQACCHPHLLKDFAQSGGPSDISAQDMMKLAKELAPDVVNRIKEQTSLNDSAQLECPICMDMAENPTIFVPCGHDTCSECFARITDPSQAIQDGETTEGLRDIKCPNCRGKITPSKVIDLQAFKKVHMRELCNDSDLDEVPPEEVGTTDDSDSDDSDDDCSDDIDDRGNIKGFIVDDDADSTENEDTADGKVTRTTSHTPLGRDRRKSKGKGKAKEKGPKKTLAQLKKEAGIGSKARKKYLRKLAKEWETSAKIEKVMEILQDLRSRKVKDGKTEKTIIFSQFTSLLDLLEFPINREGWNYRRYDGSMSPKARNDAVLDFTDKPDIEVMLVSLKAGNSGLNLVAASQVIIFDPFWNPYIEEQAIDRAHRIGQLKPVQVHRILVPNTVEDRIIALQDKKRELIESALDEKASQSIGRLGTRELAFLFDVQS